MRHLGLAKLCEWFIVQVRSCGGSESLTVGFQSVRIENVLAVLDGAVLAGEAAEPMIEEACWRLVNI